MSSIFKLNNPNAAGQTKPEIEEADAPAKHQKLSD